jgi:CRISPR-associated protein Cmr1
VVHDPGLLGSLRWWYEGLIRGHGAYACDPTDNHRCEYKEDKKDGPGARRRAIERLCPACRLFGCTSWRRRFRFEAEGFSSFTPWFFASREVYTAAGNWLWRMFGGVENGSKSGDGINVKFNFGVRSLWTERHGHIDISRCDEATEDTLLFLLYLIAKWGAIGAKAQLGFGVIRILNPLDNPPYADALQRGRANTCHATANKARPAQKNLFSFDRFFSREYRIPEETFMAYQEGGRMIGTPCSPQQEQFLPCAFDVRYKSRSRYKGHGEDRGLRPYISETLGSDAASDLFGESNSKNDDQRRAGRIAVSHLFRDGGWRLRIWGDIPVSLDMSKTTGAIDRFIRSEMFPGATVASEFDFDKEVRFP